MHDASNYEDDRAFATGLDETDPLREYRSQFSFPAERNGYSPVYFCGNSLGLMPKLAATFVREELARWAERAVDGHFEGTRPWLEYHKAATAGFAELTGALPTEVVAMNTLTVNLHMLMASFYRPTAQRHKILIEAKAFPSDRYAVASQLRLHGFDPGEGLLEWLPADDTGRYDTQDLRRMLEQEGDRIALLLLPGVQYYTGQLFDMATICRLGHAAGCKVGLDLAHAVGNVELRLHDWAPDFAAWCTYKYLNAGPGAIAGAFIHESQFDTEHRLHGWWGHKVESRFDMSPAFTPAQGAEAWQVSCPPVLSLAPVAASLELFTRAGLPNLIDKSRSLTGYLAWLIQRRFPGHIEAITPLAARGCQLSLVVKDSSIDAKTLFEGLRNMNVTGDWREPNVIRMAPVPLYNSFSDAFAFAERTGQLLENA